jgi:hypothetical protein
VGNTTYEVECILIVLLRARGKGGKLDNRSVVSVIRDDHVRTGNGDLTATIGIVDTVLTGGQGSIAGYLGTS